MLRLLLVALCGTTLIVGGAVAVGLPTAAKSLGSGTTTLVRCDSNGVGLTYQLNASGQLTSVTIDNINGACAGGTARVTLLNASTVIGSGTASLPTSGFTGKVVVTLSSTVSPSSVTKTAAAIDGI